MLPFGKKKEKKGDAALKPRTLLSQSNTLLKKPGIQKRVPGVSVVSKVSSVPITAVKTALLPYAEAVVDDIKTVLGIDNKSKQDREAYQSFLDAHFKKEK
jgi:hypothetical protein